MLGVNAVFFQNGEYNFCIQVIILGKQHAFFGKRLQGLPENLVFMLVSRKRSSVGSPNVRQTVVIVPTPSSLSTSIVPPIRFTRDLTIGRPRPVPVMWLSVEECSLVNSSKICGRYSLLMPMPLSFTVMR